MLKPLNRLALACGAAVAALAMATTAMAQDRTFNVPAQEAVRAIPEFARQAGIQIVAPADQLQGVRTQSIRGTKDVRLALAEILRGTGLTIASDDGRTIILRRTDSKDDTPRQPEVVSIDDVVVTGSRIRGAPPSSPVRTVGRDEIDRSGYATTGDVIRSLPQAFSGNANPGAFPIAGTAPVNNFSAASTADLRGLGPGATLTLLNGRRIAYNGNANIVDISLIPLPAVQRVEILTDGASSLYGSDAVAGVVNFILRDNFEGAETTLRLGGTTQGGASEQQISQLFGMDWSSGQLLFNAEYYQQESLDADQRDVSKDLRDPYSLIPEQERFSAMMVATQDLSDRASLFLQALYAEKTVETVATYSYAAPLIYEVSGSTDTTQYGVTAGIKGELAAGWRGELAATVSQSREDYFELHNVFAPYAVFFENDLRGVEVNAEGPVFTLPAGQVSAAFGAGYREETLDANFVSSAQAGSRDISFLYGEMQIPIYDDGASSLGVSLSGRHETYSEFGDVFNPKLGIVFKSDTGLKLRGTWGESFRAPTLFQIQGVRRATLYNASTFRVPGATALQTAIYVTGANPDLQPEQSTSWTFGADYSPRNLSALTLSATYYEIDYQNRIVGGGNAVGIWDNPAFQHRIIKYPDASIIDALLAPPTVFGNVTGRTYDPAQVVAIFQVNQRNAQSQSIRGVDLRATYDWSTRLGDISAFGDVSWLTIDQVDTPGATERRVSGYIYYPAEYKARAGMTWTSGAFAATGVINYVDGSIDNTGTFIGGAVNRDVPVSSWTTVDAQFSYSSGEDAGLASNIRVGLSVRNLFDRNPPSVADSSGGSLSGGLGFDPQNASALGRVVSLTLSKAW